MDFRRRSEINFKKSKRNMILTFIGGVLLFFALIFGLVYSCSTVIQKNGGLRQVIVDTGKGVKSIIHDISSDDNTDKK